MAALEFTAKPAAEVALSAATTRTIIQVTAPANHRVRVKRLACTFDGTTSGNDPVKVDLVRQSTAGSGGTAVTPTKVDDSIAESIQSTALSGPTSEPTTGDVLDTWHVHPQSGIEVILPMGSEIVIGGGDRIGIRATAPQAVNALAKLHCEE